jgi:hypothetical protein
MATDIGSAIDEAFNDHACATMIAAGGASAAFVATGSYGLAAISIPAAIVAAKKCADDKRPALPGAGIPFSGGQCSGTYYMTVRATVVDDRGVVQNLDSGEFSLPGPIGPLFQETNRGPGSEPNIFLFLTYGPDKARRQVFNINTGPNFYNARYQGFSFSDLHRDGGAPDNCGNGPIIQYPIPDPVKPYPPVIRDPDGRPILPGNTYNITYQPTVNFPPVLIPITIGPVVIKNDVSFPIFFKVSVGDISIGNILLDFSGEVTIDLKGERTDPNEQIDYRKILKEIKECACGGKAPDLDSVELPFVMRKSDGSCERFLQDFLVLKGSVAPDIPILFTDSAALALDCCSSGSPPQVPEKLIASGVIPSPSIEQFVDLDDKSIVSVRLKIVGGFPEEYKVRSFSSANQFKFGSIACTLDGYGGGGDYIYVYDADTYYPLPRGGKKKRIRLLIRSGVSWQLFDTGERIG